MTSIYIKKVVKQIERHKNEIAKRRDALRKLYEELETLDSDFTMVIESLDYSIDYLSRSV